LFDSKIRPLINNPLNLVGRAISVKGITSDQMTIAGFLVGMLALPAIYFGYFKVALLLILANRLADGLDGAIARATQLTDRGGYLDIVLDFLFYATIPFAFALQDPSNNALPAAFLLFAFMGTGSSFLGFAIMAAKRGIETDHQGRKSLYYLQGLTEGFETIIFMIMCVLFPAQFAIFAVIYGCMCIVTTATRIYSSYKTLN